MRKSKAKPLRITMGIHAVHEALNVHPKWAKELWVKESAESQAQISPLVALAERLRIPIKPLSGRRLDELGSGHQGVALQLSESPELDESELDRDVCVLLALDQVTDPHNLGAVLRTSWLFGSRGVIIPEDRSVSLTPTVCKVAQGGAEHVPIIEVSPMDQELKRLKDKGFWVFGLSHKSTQTIFDLKLPDKVVWVLGAEGSGLRKPVERACDELISIPQLAPHASFNVSVAAGVALSETYRQLFFPKASK